MSIFFWFMIIAVAALTLNLTLIVRMRRKKMIRIYPVFTVLIVSVLSAALLYAVTALHGTQIVNQKLAASLEIEPQSYQTAVNNSHAAYAFCSKEGMEFRFDDTDLLISEVPDAPSVVEIYYCETRSGFSNCYLYEGTAVRYVLR